MSGIKKVEFQIADQTHVLAADGEAYAGAMVAPSVPIGADFTYAGKVIVTDDANNQTSLSGYEDDVLMLTVHRTPPPELYLIYDRTQGDVDRVFTLKRRILTEGLSSLTRDELTEYMSGLKGAYNHTDMNRVGKAVEFIANRFKDLPVELSAYRFEKNVASDCIFSVPYDVESVVVNPKYNWSLLDYVTQTQAKTYLDNVRVLREQLTLPEDAPDVPATLDHLTYSKANDIEYVLLVIYNTFLLVEEDLYENIELAANSFLYCGEVFCGE